MEQTLAIQLNRVEDYLLNKKITDAKAELLKIDIFSLTEEDRAFYCLLESEIKYGL
jgi:hypothetical protein